MVYRMIKFRPDPGQIGLPECSQAGFPPLYHDSYRDVGFVQNNRQVVVTTICHSGLKLNYYQAQWDNDMVFEIAPFGRDDNPVREIESGRGAAKTSEGGHPLHEVLGRASDAQLVDSGQVLGELGAHRGPVRDDA